MSKDDMEGRVMVLENTLRYTMPRIEKYMEEGNRLRVESASSLSTLTAVVAQSSKYQEQCDTDRKAHDERLKALERGRSYDAGKITVASSLMAAAFGWFAKHFNIF